METTIIINSGLGQVNFEFKATEHNWANADEEHRKEYLRYKVREELLEILDDLVEDLIENYQTK